MSALCSRESGLDKPSLWPPIPSTQGDQGSQRTQELPGQVRKELHRRECFLGLLLGLLVPRANHPGILAPVHRGSGSYPLILPEEMEMPLKLSSDRLPTLAGQGLGKRQKGSLTRGQEAALPGDEAPFNQD